MKGTPPKQMWESLMFHRPSLAEEAYFKKLNAELTNRMKVTLAFSLARTDLSAHLEQSPLILADYGVITTSVKNAD